MGDRTKGRIFKADLPKLLLAAVSMTAAAVIFLIILFIFNNSTDAIRDIGLVEFLTRDVWNPSRDSYGAKPLVIGTILVTAGAILFALPLGLAAAVLLSEVVSERIRNVLKPICEVLAGIPSVVYGFFGLVVLVPFLLDLFPEHLSYGSSWLAGSILLGIMALPTIISVSDDAMRSVPSSYREASAAMGATRWETTRRIIIPAAVSGISAAAILGIGRAIGETMAVMMVTGNAAIVPEPLWNVFSLLRTITSTLALEMSEVSVGSTHYSALFLLALILMIMVLLINMIARHVVRSSKRKLEGKIRTHTVWVMADRVKRPLVLAGVFAVVFMMLSLFVSAVCSATIAFIAVALFSALPLISKRISSSSRERVAHSVLWVCMIVIVLILGIMIGDIAVKGIPALTLDFITGVPSDSGRAGGILPAIAGTLELIAGTALIALPLGILSGVFLAEYAGNSKMVGVIRASIELLNGTPSIVFGLFGMAFLVIFLGLGTSLIAGCITLSVMVLPVVIRTTEEAVRAVPQEMRDASTALGATKWETVVKVVLPSAVGGILTGTILSLGRAAGETAPIMFTAAVVMKRTVGLDLFEPIMALPYHLYYLASEVPGSEANQYGTAFVLILIVLSMFIAASMIRNHYSKKMRY